MSHRNASAVWNRTLFLAALAGVAACGGSIDTAYVRRAAQNAKHVKATLEPSALKDSEIGASDGGTFKIEGVSGEGLCFVGMVDDRHGTAAENTYQLRAFADPAGEPLSTAASSKVRVLGKRAVNQQGAVRTNQYVVDPNDGRPAGNIVELRDDIQAPVADLQICFPWRSGPPGARFLVINRASGSPGAAPSYSAWQLE